MSKLDKRFKLNLNGHCNPDCVIQGDKYRFTVLTPQMLRMEYSENGVFEDRPSQVVWNRSFDKPKFKVTDRSDVLEISTDYFHLVYNKKEFNKNNLYIDLRHGDVKLEGKWRFGEKVYGNPPREHNLKGTVRTLDRIDGPTELEYGLLDRSGRAFFNDSESLVLDEDGWVDTREKGALDYYYFGYGHDYFKAIKDFYKLSGQVPMLPRYALGNWWSRYWKYTEKSYMDLLTKFKKEDMPFSVAVFDMDWHVVDIPEKYGRGWTGYTWNKDFFPDPKRFLTWLHDNGYKTTLNVHPADGVRATEEMYQDMAKEMGVDTENEDPVNFDITDPRFLEAYFKYLHHPSEELGVDFWWMDWQQGTSSAVEGLDPLWMLNHYHYVDICRNRKRGLLLSRYAGLGSHRYPIGFSGDAVISWKSLDFQPYFTATASNVGYTWWSHDIGGHKFGYRDDELMVRWMQFGVFSPINRLHSMSSPFYVKEPWLFGPEAGKLMIEALQLRHKMIPYIYTFNWRCHNDLIPVIVPTYYYYPNSDEAYEFKNQYFFGSELMVCPITKKSDNKTGMASVEAWIPEGIWTDLFTGFVYHGGKKTVLNRTLANEPVLAKAGAIVPMAKHIAGDNSTDNPENMEIYVFPGASNCFELYEDESDGFDYKEGKYALTKMDMKWSRDKAEFTLKPQGCLSILPSKRTYSIIFRGFNDIDAISVNVPYSKSYSKDTHSIVLDFEPLESAVEIAIKIEGEHLVYDNHDLIEHVFNLLVRAQIDYLLKNTIYNCFLNSSDSFSLIASLNALNLEKPLYDALLELIVC